MTTSRFWADLSTRDFAQLDPARTVAVLPLGATEQHGPHLSLAVDRVLVDGVVEAALPHLPADLPVLFLPTQQIGYSPEHSRFDGTLTLSPATLIAAWTEIGQCVARAGVRKLLLLNAHGGQVSQQSNRVDVSAGPALSPLSVAVYRFADGPAALSMHVAAANPQAVTVAALDPAVVEREKAIYAGQARDSGKAENIALKMAEGRLRKFFEESVLLEQVYVVDTEKRVKQVVEAAAKELGSLVEVTAFVRMALGEGVARLGPSPFGPGWSMARGHEPMPCP